jgi:hypothetical protein
MYKAKWQDTTQNWQFNKLQTAFKEQFNTDLTNCTIKEVFVYNGIAETLCSDMPKYYTVETGDYEFSCDQYCNSGDQTLTEEQTTYINDWIMEAITNNDNRYSYLECKFVDGLQDADIDNLQEKAENLFNR